VSLRAGLEDARQKLRKLSYKYDPAEVVKRRYGLTGWAAELVDLGIGFLFAALLYFIILPAILGANPPAVIVQSCSMTGTLNVGDVSVLQGVKFDSIRAPLVTLEGRMNFTIEPNDIDLETTALIFPDGQRLDIREDGDVLVYISKISGNQIIHRAVARVRAGDGDWVVTKGDANKIPDAAKIDCAEFEDLGGGLRKCTKLSKQVKSVCSERDAGWPGCIGTPLKPSEVTGRQLFVIPLLGHVKLAVFHVLTLGTAGYPGPLWC
jgi:signal peptidase I